MCPFKVGDKVKYKEHRAFTIKGIENEGDVYTLYYGKSISILYHRYNKEHFVLVKPKIRNTPKSLKDREYLPPLKIEKYTDEQAEDCEYEDEDNA